MFFISHTLTVIGWREDALVFPPYAMFKRRWRWAAAVPGRAESGPAGGAWGDAGPGGATAEAAG